MRRVLWGSCALLLLTAQAQALITGDLTLKAILKEVNLVVVARVDKLDANPEAPRMVLKVGEVLRGKPTFDRMPVNLLAASAEGKKLKHTEAMLKRLEPGLDIVLLISQRKTTNLVDAFGYTNGTWFHMQARSTGAEPLVWSFLNCEPYLRRTYKGTTAELRQVIIDALAGKKEPPPNNPKEEPGLGPEVGVKKGNQRAAPARTPLAAIVPTLAVIPTVAVGGPLAILAMLFPALFGRPQDVMRRWLALLSVISILSLLYLFWPGSQANLWLILAGLTLVGAVWGWLRHRRLVRTGYGESLRPSDGEGIIFRLLSVACLALLAYGWGAGSLLTSPFMEFVLMAAVVWAGTLGVLLLDWQSRRDRSAPPGVPLEALMLSALTLVCAGMAWALATPDTGPIAEGPKVESASDELVAVAWTFKPEDYGRIDSTPLVTDDRVFIAAAHRSVFSTFGTVYCLDRASGQVIWLFNADGAMKQVFSSPFLVGERLFIGEGYHLDKECKLYCLNARTGELIWEFATMSHTESSPCVVDGKVYFGAGDDGVYCVDADTGKQIWHYQGLHVDTSPTVAGGRVFGGSGYGDRYYIFCLDAQTGKPIWREEWKLPVFGSPTVSGNQVFFGTGNGDMLTSAARPAGALLAVNADKGTLLWPPFEVPDSVLMKPAVDGEHVWFGSRDGHLYCLNRRDGTLAWRRELGSPVVAAPLLTGCPTCGNSSTLYAAASNGKVFCLDPRTGQDYWTYEVPARLKPEILSSPRLFAGAGSRRLYFGAVHVIDGSSTGTLYCLEDRYPWPPLHGHPAGTAQGE